LESLLADPELAGKTKGHGAKLASLAKEKGDTATLEVLRRYGVVD
jgi:hypothetical protein